MSTSSAQQVLPGDWSSRPVQPQLSAESLQELLEQTRSSSGEVLFTTASASGLDEVARWQRLEDLGWAGKVRALIALDGAVLHDDGDPEFLHDEVALALGVGGITAGNVLVEALSLATLPGLLEAVEAGRLTVRHVKAVLRTLWQQYELTGEERARLVELLLDRLDGTQTPGQLSKLLGRLALTMDLQAAERRKARKDSDRSVHFYPAPDGQAVLHATGPAELIAMVRASLDATLPLTVDPVDGRSKAAREFDLLVELLTGSATPGQWQASVVVPFHTATGGGLELADLLGLGPVLPGTARDLLRRSTRPGQAGGGGVSRISVDERGRVIGVDQPTVTSSQAGRSAPAIRDPDLAGLAGLVTAFTIPPVPRDLGAESYRIPEPLRRVVQARDQSCVFPGCDRPASQTDVDHRIPWPRGSTSEDNLQALCRHHHRTKQAGSTPEQLPDGSTRWTTASGWRFLRPPRHH